MILNQCRVLQFTIGCLPNLFKGQKEPKECYHLSNWQRCHQDSDTRISRRICLPIRNEEDIWAAAEKKIFFWLSSYIGWNSKVRQLPKYTIILREHSQICWNRAHLTLAKTSNICMTITEYVITQWPPPFNVYSRLLRQQYSRREHLGMLSPQRLCCWI
jgi:hypothetical protein